jgi:threonylcarbamoyladenosine tRNA methylthiotransferase MtaB
MAGTFSICSLGCKVSHYEAAWFRQQLAQRYTEVEFGRPADITVISSCTVTNTAGSKSRQMLHRARAASPHGCICLVGCYAQMEYAGDPAVFADADIVVGSSHKQQVPALIEAFLTDHQKRALVDEDLSGCPYEPLVLDSFDQVRAYLKIQDGCGQYCSYCVIPYARGPQRCLDADTAVAAAQGLVAAGHPEIVLAGIHTGRYRDGSLDLTGLIRRLLHEVDGLQRLRISSIEMTEVTDELVELMAQDPRIGRHLPIPCQSGCDRILKAMKRPYTTDQYARRIGEIRDRIPDLCLSSDVIAGFPGETEEDFAQTVSFVQEVGFSFLHVFPYSAKAHTPAARLPQQVPGPVKRQRVAKLTKLSGRLYNSYVSRFPGSSGLVLFEKALGNGWYQGHNSQYVMVKVPGSEDLTGKLLAVRYTAADDDGLTGRLEEEA